MLRRMNGEIITRARPPLAPQAVSAALRLLSAEIDSHPARSVDARQALAWVQMKLGEIAECAERLDGPIVGRDCAPLPEVHCARCRRDVATELGRQAFMN